MPFSLYDKRIGAITGSVDCEPALTAFYETEITGVVEGLYINDLDGAPSHWINSEGVATPRQALTEEPSIALLVRSTNDMVPVLTGLPAGAWVRIRPTGPMNFNEEVAQVSGDGCFYFAPFAEGVYVAELLGQWIGGPWEFEAISIENLQARRCAEVDQQKAAVIEGGMMWNGHRWQVDTGSRAALNEYVNKTLPEGFFFTDYDNNAVTLSEEQVSELAQAMTNFIFAAHAQAQSLKQVIRDATTIMDIINIDIQAEWPA